MTPAPTVQAAYRQVAEMLRKLDCHAWEEGYEIVIDLEHTADVMDGKIPRVGEIPAAPCVPFGPGGR